MTRKKDLLSLLYTFFAICIVTAMLIWPRETYLGARYGLELWAFVLVPSLLPFFIAADILINLGIVSMLGVLLEPVMRPIFNLPGSASFVLSMGFTSGFPMGAVLTRRLCEDNVCTREEGSRLTAFTNNSSPLFILAAVAVGMFNDMELGVILMAAHYCSNIILGIMLGLTAPKTDQEIISRGNIIIKSIRSLLTYQRKRKPWGQLFADSIRLGIKNVFLVGGFVLIYSVLIKLMQASGILPPITLTLGKALNVLGFDPSLSRAFTLGFLEMTLGLKELSKCVVPLYETAIAASIILAWSGLSIQSQVVSVLAGSGISTAKYHLSRPLQGILAAFLSCLFIKAAPSWSALIIEPVLKLYPVLNSEISGSLNYSFLLFNIYLTLLIFLFLCLLSLIISVLICLKKVIQKR